MSNRSTKGSVVNSAPITSSSCYSQTVAATLGNSFSATNRKQNETLWNCCRTQNKTLRNVTWSKNKIVAENTRQLFLICFPQQLQQFQSVFKNKAKTVWKQPWKLFYSCCTQQCDCSISNCVNLFFIQIRSRSIVEIWIPSRFLVSNFSLASA